jgi:hypothetical protein
VASAPTSTATRYRPLSLGRGPLHAGGAIGAAECARSTARLRSAVFAARPVEEQSRRQGRRSAPAAVLSGLGVVRDGFSVRCLTTAASIWSTAAIGIMIGSGLFIPGMAATLVTVGVLSAFAPLEDRLPT